jgi:hypothetical protein
MVSTNARTHACGPDMPVGADTMTAHAAARTDPADMRACMDTAVAHPGACANHRASMTAGLDAMAIDARARTDPADMRPGANAVRSDVRAHAHTQDMHTRLKGVCRHGGYKHQCEQRDSEFFHHEYPGAWCENRQTP